MVTHQNIKNNISEINCVTSLKNLCISNNKILNVTFENINYGVLSLKLLSKDNLDDLYYFYFNGLNDISRYQFPPYPLFKPELKTRDELYKRFNEWVKEKDWFFWMLSNSDAIGVSVLKKLNWKDDKESPNRTPTSGLAVAERYKRNGFGYFLQKIIEYQAILYGARKIFVTIKEDNI